MIDGETNNLGAWCGECWLKANNNEREVALSDKYRPAAEARAYLSVNALMSTDGRLRPKSRLTSTSRAVHVPRFA
jgi:hypothetical protein